MATVIHFNTFFGEEGEENKMNILDALELKYGSTAFAEQVFENPDDESDGFDLYVKYPDLSEVDFEFLKDLVVDQDLYVIVYDLDNKQRIGYWYDEEDEWITSPIDDQTLVHLSGIF
jgi:hypothetical protein